MAIAASGAAVAIALTPRTAPAPQVSKSAADGESPTAAKCEALHLQDLTGAMLGPYRVDSVGAIDRGGIPVQLSIGSDAFRVDILRADPIEPVTGIGRMSAVSVFLRNGGDGRTATDETKGLGAMALAEELARREAEGWKPPSALMTMAERSARDALLVG